MDPGRFVREFVLPALLRLDRLLNGWAPHVVAWSRPARWSRGPRGTRGRAQLGWRGRRRLSLPPRWKVLASAQRRWRPRNRLHLPLGGAG
ncbi:hypothetical protein HBB16_05755 [Pseudonocardia sp. MCCB 268]|nr:hypothetical protein [Pseudonocardia cytotoxica]